MFPVCKNVSAAHDGLAQTTMPRRLSYLLMVGGGAPATEVMTRPLAQHRSTNALFRKSEEMSISCREAA